MSIGIVTYYVHLNRGTNFTSGKCSDIGEFKHKSGLRETNILARVFFRTLETTPFSSSPSVVLPVILMF